MRGATHNLFDYTIMLQESYCTIVLFTESLPVCLSHHMDIDMMLCCVTYVVIYSMHALQHIKLIMHKAFLQVTCKLYDRYDNLIGIDSRIHPIFTVPQQANNTVLSVIVLRTYWQSSLKLWLI